MRVLLVSRGFPPRGRWGTEFYTHQLALGLRARGHTVAVLHALRDGSRPRGTLEESASDGFPVFAVHNAPDRRKPLADSYVNAQVERAFEELCERWRPELVHFNYLLWGLSVRLPRIARAHGLPTVVTLTDFGLLCHRGQMFDWRLRDCAGPHPAETCARCIREPSPYDGAPVQLEAKRATARAAALLGGLGSVVVRGDVELRESEVRATMESVDRFVAPTRALGDVFRRAGLAAAKVTDLVYSFDERPFLAARAEPQGELVRIGFLGQYAPHKGPHVLLEAARIMAHRLPESVEPWEVVLHGDGSGDRHRTFAARALGYSGAPRALVVGAGEQPRVRIEGPLEHARIPGLFAGLSAVVVPSLWMENAPLAALQARASGVPVIASDVPGLVEVIEPHVHGLVFPAGDARALADVLREVVLRRVKRSRRPGLALSIDAHLDRIETVYGEAASLAKREAS